MHSAADFGKSRPGARLVHPAMLDLAGGMETPSDTRRTALRQDVKPWLDAGSHAAGTRTRWRAIRLI